MTVSSDMELLVFQLSWRQGDEEERGERERSGKRKTESVGDTDREGKVCELSVFVTSSEESLSLRSLSPARNWAVSVVIAMNASSS